MDAALSDTGNCLVSRGELLNVRMQNSWQYSSFSSNRWWWLDASSSFNSSFQSKAHLLKDPANAADRTVFPFNANWPSTNDAMPVVSIIRNKGISSASSSVSCNNRGSWVFDCCKSECAWPSVCEAVDWVNAPVSTAHISIIQYCPRARLSGESLVKLAHRRCTLPLALVFAVGIYWTRIATRLYRLSCRSFPKPCIIIILGTRPTLVTQCCSVFYVGDHYYRITFSATLLCTRRRNKYSLLLHCLGS